MARYPFGITEKEAEVLRLIDKTRTSGEIATLVGRSTHTVDAQIKSARRRLGNVDRYRAADLLRRWEASNPSGVNPPWVMEPATEINATDLIDNRPADTGAEEISPRAMPDAADETARNRLGIQRTGNADGTTTLKTVALIVGIAAAATILLLAAPQLAIGAQKIAHRILALTKTGMTGQGE